MGGARRPGGRGSVHRMNHMAGWARWSAGWCRVGSGTASGWWSSASEGLSLTSTIRGPARPERWVEPHRGRLGLLNL